MSSSKKTIHSYPLLKNLEALGCQRQGKEMHHYEVSFRDAILNPNSEPEKKILASCHAPREFEACLSYARENFVGESESTPSFWELIEHSGCQIEEIPIEETYEFIEFLN